MRTSFHHQPEAQHPKSPAIYTPAGRLPHLSAKSDHSSYECELTRTSGGACTSAFGYALISTRPRGDHRQPAWVCRSGSASTDLG
jgi:hypothetical protein